MSAVPIFYVALDPPNQSLVYSGGLVGSGSCIRECFIFQDASARDLVYAYRNL